MNLQAITCMQQHLWADNYEPSCTLTLGVLVNGLLKAQWELRPMKLRVQMVIYMVAVIEAVSGIPDR